MSFSRKAAAILPALCLLSFVAATATAETMEGDHLLIIGLGKTSGSLSSQGMRSFDFDKDGTPDGFDKDPSIGDRGEKFLQYYYQKSPALALGFSIDSVQLRGRNDWDYNLYPLSAGNVQFTGNSATSASSLEMMPMARYSFMNHKRVNPYVLGGVGLNLFSSKTTVEYGFPNLKNRTDVSNSSSVGFAGAIGGGVQAEIMAHLLAGLEGRWTFCQLSAANIPSSTWNRFSAHLWIGTKWNHPL